MAVLAIVVFAATTGLLMFAIPAPLSSTDYLVIGSAATLISLSTVFAAVALSGRLPQKERRIR
ncbi:MAG: hypothetical protein LC130_17530 [Bryobacterales bacterium]|nr:hypothetical protein [Bryobacterales bacterium]MEB2360453.1 hypothetical protein [Bryobacterales bacterium]